MFFCHFYFCGFDSILLCCLFQLLLVSNGCFASVVPPYAYGTVYYTCIAYTCDDLYQLWDHSVSSPFPKPAVHFFFLSLLHVLPSPLLPTLFLSPSFYALPSPFPTSPRILPYPHHFPSQPLLSVSWYCSYLVQIAVQGCCHGELDMVYQVLKMAEERTGIKIDLLICCGDFQVQVC